jgi:hypothetical protein
LLATWEPESDPSRGIKLHDLQVDYIRDLERCACVSTFRCDANVRCCAIAEQIVVAGDELGRIHFLGIEE